MGSAIAIKKVSVIAYLNLGFAREIHGTMEHTHEQRRHKHSVGCVPYFPIHMAHL